LSPAKWKQKKKDRRLHRKGKAGFAFLVGCVIIWEVANVVIRIVTILFLVFTSTVQDIEQAFLQNNSKILFSLFSSQNNISISLPQPISFSDQVSNQQAYFLFRRWLKDYTTFEFFSESQPSWSSKASFIVKARWSFKDRKNNRYVYLIFFHFINEPTGTKKTDIRQWKLTEIKAEIENY
jgi:hypothetical protein